MTRSDAPVVVTGATGNVGLHVAHGLVDQGVPVRIAARDPDRARALFPATEVVRFAFGDQSTHRRAFEGARALFLVRPPEIAAVKKRIVPAIDAARAAGVGHVVFLSLQGADQNPVVPHRRIEDDLRAGGPAWTFLRPSFFMQNLSTTHRHDIAENDEVFVPAGRGRTSFVDTRDIAEVAVRVLAEPGHENRAYELTGSEALSYDEIADILASELGREIRYADPSPWSFWRRMRARGTAPGHVLVMIALYTACRFGLAERVTPEMEALLGRPPRTFREFARDHAGAWRPAGTPSPHARPAGRSDRPPMGDSA